MKLSYVILKFTWIVLFLSFAIIIHADSPTPVPASYYYGKMKVLYKCGDPNSSSSQIKPQINIVNTGEETIAIGDLTVHYYYTKTGVMEEVFNVDYAAMGSAHIIGSFYDGYVKIGFTGNAGNLSPSGGQTGEIQLRINRTDYEPYDQLDDYSFDPSRDTYREWDHIVLFLDGELVWGIPPGGTPEPTPTPTPGPSETPGLTPEQTADPSPTALPAQMMGDVNRDYSIDIVDALLIAQFYVGYNLDNFNPLVADVNNDDEIDIVDALLVAQYYVGIIPGF